jgi:hypothetical protein
MMLTDNSLNKLSANRQYISLPQKRDQNDVLGFDWHGYITQGNFVKNIYILMFRGNWSRMQEHYNTSKATDRS